MKAVSISTIVPAYNAEQFVAETLTSILSQTRPPEEIIVVDDGSTDGTVAEVLRFGKEVRLIRQENRGAAGAYNRGFSEARGTYVARCDADDLWVPCKLERQLNTIEAQPQVDISVGAAWIFGRNDRPFAPDPGIGLLDNEEFARQMYDWDLLCASSAVIRRSLLERIGPLVDRLVCEDYDLWLRALKLGAVFHYDSAVLVWYRQHGSNVTNNLLKMREATRLTHKWHEDLPKDRRLVRRVQARDDATIGRMLVDDGRRVDARAAFLASVGRRLTLGPLAWAILLSVPDPWGPWLTRTAVNVRRNLSPHPNAA